MHDKKTVNDRFIHVYQYLQCRGQVLGVVDFAKKVGVLQPNISAMLNGNRAVSLVTIDKLTKAYPKISREWLLTGEGDMIEANNIGHTTSGDNSPVYGNFHQNNIVGSNMHGNNNQISVGNGNTLVGDSKREDSIKQSGQGNTASIYGDANNAVQQREEIVRLDAENSSLKIEVQRLNKLLQTQEDLLQSKDKIIALLERQLQQPA